MVYSFQSLSTSCCRRVSSSAEIHSHVITVKKQSAPPPHYIKHGVIFMHVLNGSARYLYGKQQIILEPGDSLSIDAELSHGIDELLSDEFVFLSVQAETRR